MLRIGSTRARDLITSVKHLCVLAIALVGIASRSEASSIITVPAGLAPGTQYRLVYVAAPGATATSSNIADYNTAVNTQANSVAALNALGTTWLDIGSTATVNAITNIGVDPGVAIYDLAGNKIANDAGTGAGGLFSGSLLHGIFIDQNGSDASGSGAWTGSTTAGVAGGAPLGSSTPEAGHVGVTTANWIANAPVASTNTVGLYGISGVLTVSSATPEPSTALLLAGAGILFGVKRRMRQRGHHGQN